MTISRGQMNRQLRRSGGIMDVVPREQYGIGSSLKKLGKKAVGAVKDIVSSDIGKAALLAAGGYYLGGGALGPFQRKGLPFAGFNVRNLPGAALFSRGAPVIDSVNTELQMLQRAGQIPSKGLGALGMSGLAGLTGFLGSQYGMNEEQIEDVKRDPTSLKSYLRRYYTYLNPNAGSKEIEDFVTKNVSEYTSGQGAYAKGGRIGYAKGSDEIVDQASGIEGLPQRTNKAGVKELDLRQSGGFIPPVGVKEKADDIPAMLSNNEFVFTADAVRGAGDGDVDLGAQRMYDQMKRLEGKVANV